MVVFNSEKEAQETHMFYNIDTNEEGKYSGNHQGSYNRIKFFLDNIPKESYVFEVGCNSGGLLLLLERENNCIVRGIDISPEMVRRAKSKSLYVDECSAEDICCNASQFEVVILTEVLEHIYNPLKVLLECRRVLDDGGLFIGSVPHPDGQNSKKRPLEEHQWHCHIFNIDELGKLLEDAGFTNVKFEFITRLGETTPQWIGWTANK